QLADGADVADAQPVVLRPALVGQIGVKTVIRTVSMIAERKVRLPLCQTRSIDQQFCGPAGAAAADDLRVFGAGKVFGPIGVVAARSGDSAVLLLDSALHLFHELYP